jgi:hypothetical protein
MAMKDEHYRVLERLAESLDLEIGSEEFAEFEAQFEANPDAAAAKFTEILDRYEGPADADTDDEKIEQPESEDPYEDLRREWPAEQPRPRVWNRQVFASVSGKRRAFLLGCNDYKHLPSLKAPETDVQQMAETLADAGLGNFETVIFTPASSGDPRAVEKALITALAEATEDHTLLIYYSGHGFSPDDTQALYLGWTDTDFQKPDSAISLSAISEAYARTRCRSLLLILDCCQSGGVALDVARLGRKKPKPRKGEYHDAFGYSGLRVIASSSRGQDSYEDIDENTGLSVFTGGLLDGLRSGHADVDDNGTITDAEAFAYVRNRLASQRLLERQSPVHHVVEGESPFLLCLNERTIEDPHLYAIPPEEFQKHLAIQGMAALVRESAPIMFFVMCFKYYFREVEGAFAHASGLTVSPMHTPFLRASQTGFVCETYFVPNMVPPALLRLRRPVNGVVQCSLDVQFKDIVLITGRDIVDGRQWNLLVPEGTTVTPVIGRAI